MLYGLTKVNLVWELHDPFISVFSIYNCMISTTYIDKSDLVWKQLFLYHIAIAMMEYLLSSHNVTTSHGPLARYVKFWVAHAPGRSGTFSPPPQVSDPDMHHGMCITHVPWCMPGPLTSGFLWSRWRGKRSRHSRRMHNPQFNVSGKRPIK